MINPAEIADNRMVTDINLASLNFSFDNDFVGLHKSGLYASKLTKDLSNGFSFDSVRNKYNVDAWDKGKTGKIAKIMISQDALGPSVLIPLSPKNSIALSTRFRNIVNIDNVQPELAKEGIQGLAYHDLLNQKLTSDKFSLDAMGWSEINLSYAQVIPLMPDKKEHFFKAGVTLKILQGRYAAYMYGETATVNFINNKNPDSPRYDIVDTMSLYNSSMKYGHTQNVEIKPFSFFNDGVQSYGVGMDLGFVYEYRPEHESFQTKNSSNEWVDRRDLNKYKIKVGLSIMDLGGIKFKKDPESYDFTADIQNWNIYEISGINSIHRFDSLLNSNWPTADAGNQSTFKMALPTAINIYVDYSLKHNIYFNAGAVWNPVFKNDENKVHNVTQVWCTPRWEMKWFGIGMPLSMSVMGHFDAGFFGYVGPLYFGSADIIRNIMGADLKSVKLYAGIKVPIPYPKSVGVTDRDGDGVLDGDDHCIDVPGPKENQGCPWGDLDKDGVLDNADKCIDVAGPIENNGCPYGDKDGDGVLDNADKCIDVAGPKENNGCPYADKDGDGVMDNVDQCIDVAGPKENNGCPYGDRDKDGVLDNVDQCIDVAGPKENMGCPYGDRDKDGVLDKEDSCIDAPGPAINHGCPYLDTDGDGVLDKDDQCPKTPGPADNHGCPKLEQKEEEIIKRAFDNLEFDTNKDIIRSTSFPSLDELAALLKSKPSYGLRLAGHTDNVGDDAKNMQLSHDRAQAVKNYLVSKGASTDTIIVEYYGETKPIATNDTPEGRQKNRRVEMSIIFN